MKNDGKDVIDIIEMFDSLCEIKEEAEHIHLLSSELLEYFEFSSDSTKYEIEREVYARKNRILLDYINNVLHKLVTLKGRLGI